MKMDIHKLKEMKEQAKRIKEQSEKEFTGEAPIIREQLKSINTPLKFRDSAKIYRWIFRGQITIDMLPLNVKNEFTKTKHYEALLKLKIT